MAEMVRMGVRASLAADQRPLGRHGSVVVTTGEAGNEVSRAQLADEPGLVLAVLHFVDLDDGPRVTTAAPGSTPLAVPRGYGRAELFEALREFVFEDELRDIDEELAGKPRWEDLCTALREHGLTADGAALAALPFVVELAEDVLAALDS